MQCAASCPTSLQSRTMGCVTDSSAWLPSMAELVLLLRPWPFLKGVLVPGGRSWQGEVGEEERTRVFRASTSACSTSIWWEEKSFRYFQTKVIYHDV